MPFILNSYFTLGLDDTAEDYIFFTLFLGNLGAILAGIACWLTLKSHRIAPGN
jgi:hypothetical protein